jgi:hypothetical protein
VHDSLGGALAAAGTDPRMRLPPYVDPYGDTYFNTRQMPDFIADWKRVTQMAQGEAQQTFASDVVRLAERCRDGTHLMLRFVGD